jgi:GT2 family glycosyltransferase
MYAEDIDLGRRMLALERAIVFEPGAVVSHEGGASAPRAQLLPVLAASRLRYAAKHRTPPGAALERIGIALGSFTHMCIGQGGRAARAGHARAFGAMLRP